MNLPIPPDPPPQKKKTKKFCFVFSTEKAVGILGFHLGEGLLEWRVGRGTTILDRRARTNSSLRGDRGNHQGGAAKLGDCGGEHPADTLQRAHRLATGPCIAERHRRTQLILAVVCGVPLRANPPLSRVGLLPVIAPPCCTQVYRRNAIP